MTTNLNLRTLRVGERFQFAKGYNFNISSSELIDKEKIYYSKGHFGLLGYTKVRELNTSRRDSVKIYSTAIVNLI